MSASFANNDVLLNLKKTLPKHEEPAVQYKDVVKGDVYQTTKNKITTQVVVADVKKDQIVLKRCADAKDSFTISRARFDTYYVRVG